MDYHINNLTLIDIKTHMLAVKTASMTSLCRIFRADAERIRCLLAHWINKGKIRRCTKLTCSTPCAKQCTILSAEQYEWCG